MPSNDTTNDIQSPLQYANLVEELWKQYGNLEIRSPKKRFKEYDNNIINLDNEQTTLLMQQLLNGIKSNLDAPIQHHVVLDLDQVIIQRFVPNTILDSNLSYLTQKYMEYHYPSLDIFTTNADVYLLFPNFDFMILMILSWKGWSIDFFSAGTKHRNQYFIYNFMSVLLSYDTSDVPLTLDQLKDSGRIQIRSREHILHYNQVVPTEAKTEWSKIKDLRLFLKPDEIDTGNVILIDDTHCGVHQSQMPYIHIATGDNELNTTIQLMTHNLIKEITYIDGVIRSLGIETIDEIIQFENVQNYFNIMVPKLHGRFLERNDIKEESYCIGPKDEELLNILVELLAWDYHLHVNLSVDIWYSQLFHASYCLGILVRCKQLLHNPSEANNVPQSLREALHLVLHRPTDDIITYPPNEIHYAILRKLFYYKEAYYSRSVVTYDYLLHRKYCEFVQTGNAELLQ